MRRSFARSWRARELAARFAAAALDILYPPTCLACRAARYPLSADLPRVPRRDRGARRAVLALLERDAFHRAAILRAARHAVRSVTRRRPSLTAIHRRPAGFFPLARRGEVRGRAGAQARPPAQIFRPRRTRPADRSLDGPRRRRHSRRRRLSRPRAPPSLKTV